MHDSNARLLGTTRAAFAEVLRDKCDRLEDGAAGKLLEELEVRLVHLLETAPADGDPVEQVRLLATIRASLDAAVRQLETETAQR